MPDEYIPGVCNIGNAEIRLRKLFGWIGLVFSLILWGAFIAFGAAPAWRLLLFFPSMIAALGFLQAAWHFCAKFGLGGVFNFGPDIGKTDSIEQAEARRADRIKAVQIIGLSLVIAIVFAAIAFFTA